MIAKLTPNITDIREPGLMPRSRGGAHAVSLINTVQSLIGVDLDHLDATAPNVDDASSHGGYLRPRSQTDRAADGRPSSRRESDFGLPISGIGGISNWRDAAEFIALGAQHRASVHRGHALTATASSTT